MFNRSFLVMSLLFLTVACSTSQMRVLTEPSGAEVFVSQQGSQEKRSVGKTPIDLSYRDLREKFGLTDESGDFFVMTFESKDTETEKILVPSYSTGMKTMTVRVHLGPRQDVKSANSILQRMHNAQKFAQAGEFERAQIECDKVLEIDSHIVRALSLKGSVFYLQKNYSEAVKWFEKALAEDSSFDEALKMIAKIKQEHP